MKIPTYRVQGVLSDQFPATTLPGYTMYLKYSSFPLLFILFASAFIIIGCQRDYNPEELILSYSNAHQNKDSKSMGYLKRNLDLVDQDLFPVFSQIYNNSDSYDRKVVFVLLPFYIANDDQRIFNLIGHALDDEYIVRVAAMKALCSFDSVSPTLVIDLVNMITHDDKWGTNEYIYQVISKNDEFAEQVIVEYYKKGLKDEKLKCLRVLEANIPLSQKAVSALFPSLNDDRYRGRVLGLYISTGAWTLKEIIHRKSELTVETIDAIQFSINDYPGEARLLLVEAIIEDGRIDYDIVNMLAGFSMKYWGSDDVGEKGEEVIAKLEENLHKYKTFEIWDPIFFVLLSMDGGNEVLRRMLNSNDQEEVDIANRILLEANISNWEDSADEDNWKK